MCNKKMQWVVIYFVFYPIYMLYPMFSLRCFSFDEFLLNLAFLALLNPRRCLHVEPSHFAMSTENVNRYGRPVNEPI